MNATQKNNLATQQFTCGNINNGKRSKSNRASEVKAVATSNVLPSAMYDVKVRMLTKSGMAV